MGLDAKTIHHENLCLKQGELFEFCLIVCSMTHQSNFFRSSLAVTFCNYRYDHKSCSPSKTRSKKLCIVQAFSMNQHCHVHHPISN